MEYFQLALGIIGLLWIVLLIVRFSSFRRARRHRRATAPALKMSIKSGLDDWDLAIQPPPRAIAASRAEERLANLRSFCAERNFTFPETITSDSPLLREEFLESPPGFKEPIRGNFLDSRSARCGQMARLVWQSRSPELTLGERVSDVIVALHRDLSYYRNLDSVPDPHPHPSYPTLRIERLPEGMVRNGIFPWIVVIDTDRADIYREQLFAIKDWLGIGVAFANRLREVSLFEGCEVPGSAEGRVGGRILSSSIDYLVTCSHVISSECPVLTHRTYPARDGNEPDAALISEGGFCFITPSLQRMCRPATFDQTREFTMNKAPVEKSHPRSDSRRGFIRNRANGFDMNGTYHRFPHIEILPRLTPMGRIAIPFRDRGFSNPGDSGCWVMDVESDCWFGMIVGGDEHFLSTFAVEAEPLMDFFRLLLQQPEFARRFEAYTFPRED